MTKLTPKEKLKLVIENDFLNCSQICQLLETSVYSKGTKARDKANELAIKRGCLVYDKSKAYSLDVLEVIGTSIERLKLLSEIEL